MQTSLYFRIHSAAAFKLLVMDIYVMSQLWCSGLTSRTAEQNREFRFYPKNHYYMSIGLFLSWACGRTQSSVVDVKGVQRKPPWSRAYPPIHTLCSPRSLPLCPVRPTSPYNTGYQCSESPLLAPIQPGLPSRLFHSLKAIFFFLQLVCGGAIE